MRKYTWEKVAKKTVVYDKEGNVVKGIEEIKSKKQYSVTDRILIVIDSLKGKEIARKELEKRLEMKGVPSPSDVVDRLKSEGHLYEPKYGLIKVIG